jgi:hypothetical protein
MLAKNKRPSDRLNIHESVIWWAQMFRITNAAPLIESRYGGAISFADGVRGGIRCGLASIVGSLAVCLVLGGCAVKSRVLKEPLPTPVTDLKWTAAAPEGITLELDQVIVRNSGGSWVRDANWDEYVLMVRNDSGMPVEIKRFNLYSDKVLGAEASSTSREQLEARSSATLRGLKDAGIVAGAGVASAGVVVAIVGTGGTMVAGATAAAAVAGVFVLMPVALIGSTVYVVKRHHRDRDDKVLIEHELVERGYSVPVELSPGVPSKKSAFFPITPAPTRLVLEYTAGGESRQLALELPALAGLHLKAFQASSPSSGASGPTP